MDYFDLCISDPSEQLGSKMVKLGWQDPSSYSTVILETEDWGELKKKIGETREENHVIAVRGGDEKINRKTVTDPRVDLLVHPGRGRKDSGLDKGIAETAAENNIAIALDFSRTRGSSKEKVHLFTEWRKNLKICRKYDVSYTVTTAAEDKYEIRSPRDLDALLDSLGFSGRQAFETAEQIIHKNREKLGKDLPGGVKKK